MCPLYYQSNLEAGHLVDVNVNIPLSNISPATFERPLYVIESVSYEGEKLLI